MASTSWVSTAALRLRILCTPAGSPARQRRVWTTVIVALGLLLAGYVAHVQFYVFESTQLTPMLVPVGRKGCDLNQHANMVARQRMGGSGASAGNAGAAADGSMTSVRGADGGHAQVPSREAPLDMGLAPMPGGVGDQVGSAAVADDDEGEADSGGSLNIAIFVLFDEDMWDATLSRRSLGNKARYAMRHGYTFKVMNDVIDRSRPTAWSKLLAAQQLLFGFTTAGGGESGGANVIDGGASASANANSGKGQGRMVPRKPHEEEEANPRNRFDYVFYMDIDMVIMNPLVRLETIIAKYPHKDLIAASDYNGINSGAWLARRSSWTLWFLETCWAQERLVGQRNSLFRSKRWPFEYEQRCFHFLTDSDVWQQRDIPRYQGNVQGVRDHIVALPQCAFNSFAYNAFADRLPSGVDREDVQYVDGDFIIHFAGKKGANKADLMDYYLSQAEKDDAKRGPAEPRSEDAVVVV